MKYKKVSLSESDICYINSFKKEKNISTFSLALRNIISEHKENNDNSKAKAIIDEIEERYKNSFTRMRLNIKFLIIK